jgi:hypothetical protein
VHATRHLSAQPNALKRFARLGGQAEQAPRHRQQCDGSLEPVPIHATLSMVTFWMTEGKHSIFSVSIYE